MGDTAKNLIKQNAGYKNLNDAPQFQDFGNWRGNAEDAYASGKTSLQDALKSMSGGTYTKTRREELQKQIAALKGQLPQQDALAKMPGGIPNQQGSINGQIEQLENKMKDLDSVDATTQQRQNDLFTNPLTGTLAATDQVKDNDLFKGMFGKGGINDQRQAEESRLMHSGFSLQPEDYEAYGQSLTTSPACSAQVRITWRRLWPLVDSQRERPVRPESPTRVSRATSLSSSRSLSGRSHKTA
jgi:hypothetical protein